jgi:hypothetical protein
MILSVSGEKVATGVYAVLRGDSQLAIPRLTD